MTRTEIAEILTARLKAYLDLVSISNLAIDDAIGHALRLVGLSTTSLLYVSDSDLSAVTADQTDAVLDISELRLLESILTNFDFVSTKTGPIDEKYGELSSILSRLIPQKRESIESEYGDLLVRSLSGSQRRTRVIRAVGNVD